MTAIARPRPVPSSRSRERELAWLVAAVALHVLLGFLFPAVRVLATVHALGTVAFGLWVAATSKNLQRIVMVAAYIVGCDVLWRMAEATFFYEGPKYVVATMLGIAYVRLVRTRRQVVLPIAYLLLLAPSAILTISALGLSGSREALSFTLSGPLSLGVSAVFFLQVKLRWPELRRIFLVMVVPITAIATIATFGTVTSDIEFGSEAVHDASGNFGPNQVATLLGLGALLCIILLLRSTTTLERVVFIGLGLWLFGQGALTFSRGGVLSFVIAAAVVVTAELLTSNRRGVALLLVVVAVVAGTIVSSQLNEYTGGALDKRFSTLDSTGRTEIADSDYGLWAANPITGVGPGMAALSRPEKDLASELPHTEFTRLVAEHGTLGLAAMGALLLIAARAMFGRTTAWGRTLSVALALWVLLGMLHADMRTASAGFVFGLAMIRVHSGTPAARPLRPALA